MRTQIILAAVVAVLAARRGVRRGQVDHRRRPVCRRATDIRSVRQSRGQAQARYRQGSARQPGPVADERHRCPAGRTPRRGSDVGPADQSAAHRHRHRRRRGAGRRVLHLPPRRPPGERLIGRANTADQFDGRLRACQGAAGQHAAASRSTSADEAGTDRGGCGTRRSPGKGQDVAARAGEPAAEPTAAPSNGPGRLWGSDTARVRAGGEAPCDGPGGQQGDPPPPPRDDHHHGHADPLHARDGRRQLGARHRHLHHAAGRARHDRRSRADGARHQDRRRILEPHEPGSEPDVRDLEPRRDAQGTW